MTELRRVLKLRTVVSTSTGMAIATSCYLAGLQIAAVLVGELAWISVLVAGFFCFLSAMCFSELTSLYPSAAGIKLFIQNAFNEKAAIIIGMFYVVLGISMVGAESYLLSSVLTSTIRLVSPSVDRYFWMFFFLFFVAYINYRGVVITGFVQDVMTYVMIAFLIGVSVYSISTHGVNVATAVHSAKFTLGNVIQAAGVGVFLFVGYEWVAPLAEETMDYKLIGKGMLWAIGLLTVTYALFVVGMYVGLTAEQLKEQLSTDTPIPHILFGRNLFGPVGALFFVLMSILASVTSFNSGLLNTSRFSYAMARDNVLPRVFSNLHPAHASPWVSILFLALLAAAVSLLTLLTGQYFFLIVMAAALECFIYIVAAVCVIRLRRKFPEKERSFKVPLGDTIPVVTIVVFTGLMIGMFSNATRDYEGRVLFQNYWVAIVMAGFFLFTTAYTLTIVPIFKKRAEERAKARVKRRPGRG
jgi:amino acid transporter